MATSEAQKKASRKWYENNKDTQMARNKKYQDENKEKINHQKAKSSARSFIKNKADIEDLEELRILIDERELELKNMV